LWRAGTAPAYGEAAVLIDLLLSVQTDAMHCRPELFVSSLLPSAVVPSLVDRETVRLQTLDAQRGCSIRRDGGPACLVFRLPGVNLSYAEMVHPADFVQDRLAPPSGSPPMLQLHHRLFPEPLEKGVVLRARVRGLLFPAGDDARIAAECYAALEMEDPPLAT
jgi:hypothetical protein